MVISYAFFMSKEMAEVLREAIRKSGLSARQLCAMTRVPQQRISSFLSGKDMTLRNAHKLADYLGLELRPKKR